MNLNSQISSPASLPRLSPNYTLNHSRFLSQVRRWGQLAVLKSTKSQKQWLKNRSLTNINSGIMETMLTAASFLAGTFLLTAPSGSRYHLRIRISDHPKQSEC